MAFAIQERDQARGHETASYEVIDGNSQAEALDLDDEDVRVLIVIHRRQAVDDDENDDEPRIDHDISVGNTEAKAATAPAREPLMSFGEVVAVLSNPFVENKRCFERICGMHSKNKEVAPIDEMLENGLLNALDDTVRFKFADLVDHQHRCENKLMTFKSFPSLPSLFKTKTNSEEIEGVRGTSIAESESRSALIRPVLPAHRVEYRGVEVTLFNAKIEEKDGRIVASPYLLAFFSRATNSLGSLNV
ncbi:unnamed protein product, partial [Mesorhabditis belari]|uniref:Uncharacterized protein n=1 Tax=Mesorhabditis belari TaxID=2138241 RepID=A0AAF3F188_9BILA